MTLLSHRLLLAAVLLSGCKLPDVNLATPKPLEVNLNMRLDVYQYSGDKGENKEALRSLGEATDRQRNRMSELRELKSNGHIGEDHRGLLQIRDLPPGDWGERTKKLVQDENDDRTTQMRAEAQRTNRPLHEVQDDQWKRNLSAAFKNEWVEQPGEKEGTFKWVQAQGVKEKK